jgi:osmoprotectant transport system ATP-binding protein
VALEPALVARVGDANQSIRDRATASGDDFVLLIDDRERPLGWIEVASLAGDGKVSEAQADPMSPLLDRRTTLKDATSRLLDEEVRNGVVVDRDGRVMGLLTLRTVMDWMQDDRSRVVPDDIAEAVAEVVPVPDGAEGEAAVVD